MVERRHDHSGSAVLPRVPGQRQRCDFRPRIRVDGEHEPIGVPFRERVQVDHGNRKVTPYQRDRFRTFIDRHAAPPILCTSGARQRRCAPAARPMATRPTVRPVLRRNHEPVAVAVPVAYRVPDHEPENRWQTWVIHCSWNSLGKHPAQGPARHQRPNCECWTTKFAALLALNWCLPAILGRWPAPGAPPVDPSAVSSGRFRTGKYRKFLQYSSFRSSGFQFGRTIHSSTRCSAA